MARSTSLKQLIQGMNNNEEYSNVVIGQVKQEEPLIINLLENQIGVFDTDLVIPDIFKNKEYPIEKMEFEKIEIELEEELCGTKIIKGKAKIEKAKIDNTLKVGEKVSLVCIDKRYCIIQKTESVSE